MKNLFRNYWVILSLGYIVLILTLSATVIIFLQCGKPIDWITQDPASSQHFNPYMGCISHLGIIIWAFSAAICLFSAFVSLGNKRKKKFLFLLFSGLLSVLLLFDDLFMFHEVLFPFYLNVGEKAIFIMQGITMLVYLFVFRSHILSSKYIILILALIFFGLSILQDVFLNNMSQFIEDSWKFLGIFTWFFYWAITCYEYLVAETVNINETGLKDYSQSSS